MCQYFYYYREYIYRTTLQRLHFSDNFQAISDLHVLAFFSNLPMLVELSDIGRVRLDINRRFNLYDKCLVCCIFLLWSGHSNQIVFLHNNCTYVGQLIGKDIRPFHSSVIVKEVRIGLNNHAVINCYGCRNNNQ